MKNMREPDSVTSALFRSYMAGTVAIEGLEKLGATGQQRPPRGVLPEEWAQCRPSFQTVHNLLQLLVKTLTQCDLNLTDSKRTNTLGQVLMRIEALAAWKDGEPCLRAGDHGKLARFRTTCPLCRAPLIQIPTEF